MRASLNYASFVNFVKNCKSPDDSTLVKLNGSGKIVVKGAGEDKIGGGGFFGWKRADNLKADNNAIRNAFLKCVLDECGVNDAAHLPSGVKKAMSLNDYCGVFGWATSLTKDGGTNTGKPLSVRRIQAVQTAITQAKAAAVFDSVVEKLFTNNGKSGRHFLDEAKRLRGDILKNAPDFIVTLDKMSRKGLGYQNDLIEIFKDAAHGDIKIPCNVRLGGAGMTKTIANFLGKRLQDGVIYDNRILAQASGQDDPSLYNIYVTGGDGGNGAQWQDVTTNRSGVFKDDGIVSNHRRGSEDINQTFGLDTSNGGSRNKTNIFTNRSKQFTEWCLYLFSSKGLIKDILNDGPRVRSPKGDFKKGSKSLLSELNVIKGVTPKIEASSNNLYISGVDDMTGKVHVRQEIVLSFGSFETNKSKKKLMMKSPDIDEVMKIEIENEQKSDVLKKLKAQSQGKMALTLEYDLEQGDHAELKLSGVKCKGGITIDAFSKFTHE